MSTNLDSGTDIESMSNLNQCREAISMILSGQEVGLKKNDKVSKAQDVVNQAKMLMGDNVKKMIDN